MTKKILIADDEEYIRELIKASLEDGGYEISEAEDGILTLDLVRKVIPDLVILDIMMPGIIGYRVCEEIKKNPDTAHTKVIFVSARGHEVSKMTGQMAGGDDYLVKPFEPQEIREMVKKWLG